MIIFNTTTFAKALKNKINKRESALNIGNWAYEVLLCNEEEMNNEFKNILNDLSFMSSGKEFEYSYDELNAIVNKLLKNGNKNEFNKT